MIFGFKDRTVLLVGNGAISHGWVPVERALQKVMGTNELVLDPTEYFSYLVFQLRALSKNIRSTDLLKLTTTERHLREILKDRFQLRQQLQREITQEMNRATESREIDLQIPKEPNIYPWIESKDTTIITTNWDQLIQKKFPNHQVIHLHGSVAEPDSIYFPSEISYDDFKDTQPQVVEKLNQVRKFGLEKLSEANHIVIWGLNLQMYDAETCILLGDAELTAREKVIKRTYTVIDPCQLPARRLLFITGREPRWIRPDGRECLKDCCRS